MTSFGLSGDLDFRSRIYQSSSSGSCEPQLRRPLQGMRATISTFGQWKDVVITESLWKTEKFASLKFICPDSREFLVDRLQELKIRVVELLRAGKSDEARNASLFIGGVVLKLFDDGVQESASNWTEDRMKTALSMPWWHAWTLVGYQSCHKHICCQRCRIVGDTILRWSFRI